MKKTKQFFFSLKSDNQNTSIQKFIFALSIFLFSIKWFAWNTTCSIAILTDSLESITNILSSFIGLYSLYLAAIPKDRNHPYGHGKVEFISAFIEGFFIIITGVMIFIESFFRWGNSYKEIIQNLKLGIFILLGTVLINYIVGIFACRIGNKNHSLALLSSGKHLQVDAISTFVIVLGLILLYFTGWIWIDIFSALIFSILIVYTGIRLLRQAASGVMDESDEKLIKLIVNYLKFYRKPNWIDFHNLRIIKYGSYLHIDGHLTMPWFFNIRKSHHEIDTLRKVIKKKISNRVEFFIHVDPCTRNSCPVCLKKDCLVRVFPFKHQISWNVENISEDCPHRIEKI